MNSSYPAFGRENIFIFLDLVEELKKYFWECCIFAIDFRLKFRPKHCYLTYGITIFHGMGIFFLVKRPNYPYCPTITHRWLPFAVGPLLATVLHPRTNASHHPLSPNHDRLPSSTTSHRPLTLDHRRSISSTTGPPSSATGPPSSAKGTFENMKNIHGNSICL